MDEGVIADGSLLVGSFSTPNMCFPAKITRDTSHESILDKQYDTATKQREKRELKVRMLDEQDEPGLYVLAY